jgi:hypothetical protein
VRTLISRLAITALTLAALPAFACGDGGDDGPPPRRVNVVLTNGGCQTAASTLPAGPVRFVISNPTSSSVTTFKIESDEHGQIGRVSNVLGGLSRELTVTLEQGPHTIECITGSQGGVTPLIVT